MKKMIIPLLLLFCASCAATYKHDLHFNTLEPLRVAVVPFGQVDSEGKFMVPDESLLIDDVALLSSSLKDTPASFVQKLVQYELSKTSLDIVSPGLVDAQISHRGFLKSDLTYDHAKIFGANPTVICTELLSCDAVLYGKITKWDRSYFAVQSVSTVGLDLTLVSAKDGKVLFSAHSEDSDSRGISKVPTGFSDLVIEPIKGLSNDVIAKLATLVARESVKPLLISSRPEFLNTPAPAIFASSHDATSGTVLRDSPLTVVMLGSPDQTASFSIGDMITRVPMRETTEGHYIGQFLPLSKDTFHEQTLSVYLTDQFGRSTSQRVGHTTLSLAANGAHAQ